MVRWEDDLDERLKIKAAIKREQWCLHRLPSVSRLDTKYQSLKFMAAIERE
jgi:hypothetical protein